MALNLDTAIRVVAKVAGLNEFQSLTDSLGKVQSTAEASAAGLQQTAAGSARTAQEAAKAASASRAQSTALQELQAKSRSSAAELQRMGIETRGVGGAVQQLRGQTGGAFDQLAGGATKASNNIRQLSLSFQPTEQQLSRLRNQVLEFGAANKQSERSLNQQVQALKNLRSQAEINGSLYQRLTGDIERVGNASKSMSSAVQSGADGLRRIEAGSKSSAAAIQEQIKSLQQLQIAFSKSSDDYQQIGQSIDRLKQKLGELGTAPEPGIRGIKLMASAMEESVAKQETSIGKLRQVLNSSVEGYRAIGQQIEDLKRKTAGFNPQELMTPGGAARGVTGAIGSMVQLRRDLAGSMAGRVVLTGEGLAAAGVAGGVGAGAAAGMGGIAAQVNAVATSLSDLAAKAQALPGPQTLKDFLSAPFAEAAAGINHWSESLSAAQAKLTALSTPFEAIGHAISAIGPEGAAAAGAASLAIASVYQVLSNQANKAQAEAEAAFKGISDSAQKALQDLVRIYEKVPSARMEAQERLRQQNIQRLANAPSGSVEARQAANAVAVAEREIAKIKGEQNQLLEQARSRQQAGSEALKSQVQIARDRLEVQRRLTAEIKASAEEDRLARQIAGAIRRNEERTRPQREADAEAAARTQGLIEQAKQRLQQQQALTAEIKRGNAQLQEERAIRGSIRRYEERQQQVADRAAREQADLARRAAQAFAPSNVLALPAAGQTTFQGVVSAEGFGGGVRRLTNFETAGTRDVIGAAMASQTNASAAGAEKLRGKLAQLFIEIDKVQAASNGSVSALQRQRAAWEALRVAVNPAAPAYERARLKVQELDAQLQKLSGTQEKVAARRGFGREALGGAMGALATGGGIQGALGAAAGTLAFSGGPAGIVAGAALAAAGGLANLAVKSGLEAETAQVRLKALTDQFGEYNQAQAATARISQQLRISTTESQDAFSKLYAALRPTGITIKQIEDAYVGFTAAARVSGATAEESAGALLQLKQALGSGVLQGDELRALKESAPLAAQAIARELGASVGELKKLGAEGKITSDVVIRALASLKEQNLDKLNEQFNTGAQALKDLGNATTDLGIVIAKTFGPTAVSNIRNFTKYLKEAIDQYANFFNQDSNASQRVADRMKAREAALRETQKNFNTIFNAGQAEAYLRRREDEIFNELQQQRATRTVAPDRPITQQQTRESRARAAVFAQSNTALEQFLLSPAEREQRKRAAAQRQTTPADDKKKQDEQTSIRLNAEKRLADFREQSIRRAADLERDIGEQRKDIERTIAEGRIRIARQQEDRELEQQRRRLRAQGLGTEGVDAAARIREISRQLDDETLQAQQNATDRKVQLERSLGDYQLSVARGISDILQDAADKMAEKMKAGGQAAAAAMTGAPLPATGIIARTGRTGDATGPHLDARWADGRRITAADADRYLSVNGRAPSSYGVTSGYGPRNLFGRSFHAGMDFGTPSGSGISLKGGASLLRDLGFTGAGGYAIEIMTPQGPMRLLHLQAGSVARGGGRTAPLATPKVDAAGAQLSKLLDVSQAVQVQGAQGKAAAAYSADLTQITSQLDDQLKSSTDQLRNYERMVQLQRSGLSPELAKQRADLEDMARVQLTNLQGRGIELELERQKTKEGSTQRQILDDAIRQNDEQILRNAGIVDQIMLQNKALEQQQIIQERNRQLAQGIASTIGNGIGSAIDLLIDGTDNWGQSLQQIAAGVLKDIAKQLLQIMVIQPLTNSLSKGLTSIFGGVGALGGIGFAGGGAASGFGIMPGMSFFGNLFADGGIMTSEGPLPLRTYASGGIANSPQLAMFGEGSMPEAYVPLPDGRRIPVAMKGGGGGNITTVNVNVDASGSKIQGDASQGAALGRAVSQAVQAELIRQKRPGGLLAA